MTNHLSIIDYISCLLNRESRNLGFGQVHRVILNYLLICNKFSSNFIAIKEYLGISSGAVSQSLSFLEKKGLIKKVNDEFDKRKVLVYLTKEARELLASGGLTPISYKALKSIDKSDLEALEKLLFAYLNILKDESNLKQFGSCKKCVHFKKHFYSKEKHLCGLMEEIISEGESQKICAEFKS